MTSDLQRHAHELSRISAEAMSAEPEALPSLEAAWVEAANGMLSETPETMTDCLALAWLAGSFADGVLPYEASFVSVEGRAALRGAFRALVEGLERVSGESVSKFDISPSQSDTMH